MSREEFIELFEQASEEVKNQVSEVLEVTQQQPEPRE